MSQASSARIEKRLGKKTTAPRPTQSFSQMMSQAQLNALKPFIQGLVAEQFQQATQGIYQFVMNERSSMMTRQLAFERLLKDNCPWFTEDALAMTVALVEDEALGLVQVTDEAKEGDKIRLDFQAMESTMKEYGKLNKLAIHSLNTKGPNGNVQTHETMEQTIVGMKLDEAREFLIPETVEEGKEPEHTRIRVVLKRISRKPAEETKGE